MASVLPTGWQAHRGGSLGSHAKWCELSLYLVSFRPLAARVTTDKRSYDPEFEQWEFGKLSAMREIAFAIEAQYQYYYMGMLDTVTFSSYFIH
jgi:hypothetical protein